MDVYVIDLENAMQLVFEAVSEPRPGPKWQALFRRYWPAYRAWYLSRRGPNEPSGREAKQALRRYMPELVPTYERLIELTGGDELAARLLSCYRPPAYLVGCSQAVLSKPGRQRVLVRNYDLDPRLNEGLILHSAWNGRQVIATSEFMWGVADGMNDAGLALSLAFGGSRTVGDGFGIPLILRYVLEVCDDLSDAIEVLGRVPSHMAYNITLLDRHGECATVQVAPNRPARILKLPVATNHQGAVEWAEHARFTATLEREKVLSARIADGPATERDLIRTFLRPPLYNTDYSNGFGTLYTAVYRPDQGTVQWQWPEAGWSQSFATFREGTRTVDYTASGARVRAGRVGAAQVTPRTETVPQAGRWHDGRWHDTVADPAIATRQGLHTMRTALQSAGYAFSPGLSAWFDAVERGDRIAWETLGAVFSAYPHTDPVFSTSE